MIFDSLKKKTDTIINDRIIAPTRTAIVISIAAFIIAGIALIVVVNKK